MICVIVTLAAFRLHFITPLLMRSLLKDSWFLILLDVTSRHGSKIKHAVHSMKKQQHFATTATTIAVHTVSTAQAFKIIWLGVIVLRYITYFINYFKVHRCSLNRIQVDRHPQRFPYSPRRETLMQEVGILNFEHSQLYRAGPHVRSIPEAHYYTQDNIIINITWTFLCLTLFSCRWLCTVLVCFVFWFDAVTCWSYFHTIIIKEKKPLMGNYRTSLCPCLRSFFP